jgi:hypothetical protein
MRTEFRKAIVNKKVKSSSLNTDLWMILNIRLILT